MMSFIGFVRGGLRGKRWMFEYAELLKGDLWARLVIGVVDPNGIPKAYIRLNS